jgi:plasmid replication initiation protein
LVADLKKTYRKLLNSTIGIQENEYTYVEFVLFTRFRVDSKNQTVSIITNKEFEYVLNAVTGNFTRFELEQFVSLSKTNSKTVYRMLKQFRMTGFWTVDYQEFLEMIGVSHWSRMDISTYLNLISKKSSLP